jgi:hypothetical protein
MSTSILQKIKIASTAQNQLFGGIFESLSPNMDVTPLLANSIPH